MIKSNPASLGSLILVITIVFIAIFAPLIAPYPQDAAGAISYGETFEPPSWEHPFGTGGLGRDILSLVIMGARISLLEGVVVVGLSVLIGFPLGIIAGYYRGSIIDEGIMRVADMFLSFPPLLLAMLIATTLGRGAFHAMFAVGISWWPWYTRLARSRAAAVREERFVEAARALGMGDLKILLKHVIPNSIAPVIIMGTMDMGSAILITAGLAFLGIGAQPPTPEWGLLVYLGRSHLITYWWYSTFPGLAILITVLAFNVLGDGLRKALTPSLRRLRRG